MILVSQGDNPQFHQMADGQHSHTYETRFICIPYMVTLAVEIDKDTYHFLEEKHVFLHHQLAGHHTGRIDVKSNIFWPKIQT